MRTNQAGIDLIKRFEGLTLEAKRDTGKLWQIGYGHTHGVREGDVTTPEQAEMFLREDLQEAEFAVESLVTPDLNPNQFSALVSLVYNIGARTFTNSSLRKLLNDGDFESAAGEFHKYDHAGGQVIRGLTRRRQAEEELFRRQIKALGQSRIVRAGTVGAASTTALGITDQVQQAQDTLTSIAPYVHVAQYLLLAITLLSFGFAIYARVNDHNMSVR